MVHQVSYSLSDTLAAAWRTVTGAASSVNNRLIHPIARKHILRALAKISTGQITVVTSDTSETLTFGSPNPSLQATLHVKSESIWGRIALSEDLGLAEGYMYGDIDCDDVSSLIQILILNREQLQSGTGSLLTSILGKYQTLANSRFIGSLANSRNNISAHYDIGNIMFSAYLSEDMNYSSAIFQDFNEDLDSTAPVETLEDAQMRKMKFLLAKADIQDGDRVLEIGTGWGALAILAAQTRKCTIETITLSTNQCALARERIKEAQLSDRITVHCMDFRECRHKPEWAGAFDKLISVEMIEHVGKEFFAEYWGIVDWALKPDTGVAVVQGITLPEARAASYDNSVDFIRKWVLFPGGYLPSFSFLVQTLNEASVGRLIVDSVVNIGPHYARTLREWKRRFLSNWDTVVSKALVDTHQLDAEQLETFKRKWIYYFDYCEAGFKTRSLGDHILTMTREGNMGFRCDIPV